MDAKLCKWVLTVGLMGVGATALADDAKPKTAHPQEPVGFLAGGIIGAFAAGPIGALAGAGIGTWLGHSVHRAADASRAEAQVAALQSDKSELQEEKLTLAGETARLAASNQSLNAKLEDLSQKVASVELARADASEVLDGLQGDVLFRTGSAEITVDIAHQIEVLARAVAKSPELRIRVDGYADARGTADVNLKLSQERANAVRDLLLASGISEDVLEVNAYGKAQSIADDGDGYALQRRVRLTLQMDDGAAAAQIGQNE